MIESSAQGEDYDGVIFSQLVCEHYLTFQTLVPPSVHTPHGQAHF